MNAVVAATAMAADTVAMASAGTPGDCDDCPADPAKSAICAATLGGAFTAILPAAEAALLDLDAGLAMQDASAGSGVPFGPDPEPPRTIVLG